MTTRITNQDLHNMMRRYTRAMVDAGALEPGDRMHLTIGSRTNGIAYRVHRMPAGKSGHWNPPIGPDFLGWSNREAWDALAMIAATVEDTVRRLTPDGARHHTTWIEDKEIDAYIAP